MWVWVLDSWIACAAVARAIVKDTIRRNVSFNHKKDTDRKDGLQQDFKRRTRGGKKSILSMS